MSTSVTIWKRDEPIRKDLPADEPNSLTRRWQRFSKRADELQAKNPALSRAEAEWQAATESEDDYRAYVKGVVEGERLERPEKPVAKVDDAKLREREAILAEVNDKVEPLLERGVPRDIAIAEIMGDDPALYARYRRAMLPG